MSSAPVSRRRLFQAAGVAAIVSAVAVPGAAHGVLAPTWPDIGALAEPFAPGRVALTSGRWYENQNRTLAYLRHVDVDRLLYNFRANHRLSTGGTAPCGGWDVPTFPFRTHMQGATSSPPGRMPLRRSATPSVATR